METTRQLDEEKIKRFASIFDGRKDAWGMAPPEGGGRTVRGEVTLEHYRRHLQGEVSLGIFPLLPDSTCQFGAVDIDRKDPALAKAVYDALVGLGLSSGVYMEQSRGKGYHVWILVDQPIPAKEMQTVLKRAVADAGLPDKTEIFPKQADASAVEFGNYINLPFFGETDGPRMVLSSEQMQPMPLSRFLMLCQSAPRATLRAIASNVREPASEQGSRPPAGQWIVGALSGVEEGQRNETAAKLAGYFKNLRMPEDVALSILGDWADRCDPAFDGKELASVVTGIYRRYLDPAIEREVTDRRFSAVSLATFLAETPDRIEWLVEPFIPRGGMVALVGKPASGKTWLALDLAVSIASGRRWLGKYDVTSGPVLLIDEESPPAVLKSRLEMLIRAAGLDHSSLPIEVASKMGLNLSNDQCIADLREAIDRIRPILVVIDAFAEVHRESENSADEVAKIFNRLRRAGHSCDPSFVVLHHNKKDGGSFRGSSHIEATLDTMLAIGISDDDTSKVEHAKARCSAKVQPFGVRRVISEARNTAQLLLVAPPPAESDTARRTGRKVMLAKDSIARFFGFREDWTPKDELRDALAEDDIDEVSLNAALGHLEDEGMIERRKDPANGTKKQFRWTGKLEDRGPQSASTPPSTADEPGGCSALKVMLAKGFILDVLGFEDDWISESELHTKMEEDDIDIAALDEALRELEDEEDIERTPDVGAPRYRLVGLKNIWLSPGGAEAALVEA